MFKLNPETKLLDEQPEMKEPHRSLSERFGVAESSIHNIRNKITWKHLIKKIPA